MRSRDFTEQLSGLQTALKFMYERPKNPPVTLFIMSSTVSDYSVCADE